MHPWNGTSFTECLVCFLLRKLLLTFSVDSMQRVHAALATMLRLCPKGNSDLFPILASNFPFRTKPANILVWYTKQCLTVLEYVPTLSAQVLELIVDKCLEMDVEIKIHNDGQVSIDKEVHDAEEEMFELDLDEPDTNKLEKEDTEEKVDEMADKVRVTTLVFLWRIRYLSLNNGAVPLVSWIRSCMFCSSTFMRKPALPITVLREFTR